MNKSTEDLLEGIYSRFGQPWRHIHKSQKNLVKSAKELNAIGIVIVENHPSLDGIIVVTPVKPLWAQHE